MAIKIHQGFKLPGKGLSTTAIMSLLTERVIKGDDDSILISELQSLTAETRENVIADLRFLCEKGWLKIKNGEWEEAGSIRIEGFCIDIGVDQMTLGVQPTAPTTGSPTTKREETGIDEVDLGGFRYFGTVDFDGSDPDGPKFELIIQKQEISTPPAEATDVYGRRLDTRERAWTEFDNFVQKDSRENTGDQIYLALGGTEWTMEVRTIKDPFGPDELPEKNIQLTIFRQASDEATSTKVVEEAFESHGEAWNYVDEYLGPIETELAAEVEPEVEAS